ncbi:MAG: hypothetical protein ABFS46_12150, partial [Myxococcota bacterium]
MPPPRLAVRTGGPEARGGWRPPRLGVQAELVLGLALVMGLATLVLTAVLVVHGEARLRDLLGRALLVEAQAPGPLRGTVPGTFWWTLAPDGAVRTSPGEGTALDPASRRLAEEARAADAALLLPGAVWESIRFAVPLEVSGEVTVARLPR